MPYFPIGSVVRDALTLDAGVIVAGVAAKIYPRVLPQNTVVPAVSYQVLSEIPYDDISGNAGLYRAVIEFKIWSKTAAQAAAIEEAIRLAIQGYQGINLTVRIIGVHHLHTHDDFEGEIGEYNQLSRFGVFYRRENPAP